MINIVTLSSERYLVDAGMGGFGPTIPLPLTDGHQAVSLSPRNVRLVRGCLPEHTSCHSANQMWQFEVRNGGDDKPWIPTYAFTETEFIPIDFDMINWYITADRRSFFTHKILVCRLLLDQSQSEIVGDLMLYENGFRRRVNGQVELELGCSSEKERVELLEKHFGIRLTPQEQGGIRYTLAEIP
jgi:arylamine N-acetyltransferase